MENMNESSDFTIKPCTKCNNYVPIDMSRIMESLIYFLIKRILMKLIDCFYIG